MNTDQLLLHMEFISITFSATISHCFLTDGLQDMLAPQGAPDQNLCRDSQVSQGNARGSEWTSAWWYINPQLKVQVNKVMEFLPSYILIIAIVEENDATTAKTEFVKSHVE